MVLEPFGVVFDRLRRAFWKEVSDRSSTLFLKCGVWRGVHSETRGSFGLTLGSDSGRRTGVRPICCSLDLFGPRRTLLVWSPTVSPRHGFDGHEPLRDNGHFDSNGTRGNARVVVAGHRTLRRIVRRPRATESDGHLCDLMALFHGASI
jgi:hypothetical protein